MKITLLILIFLSSSYVYSNNISKINALKKEAKQAFLSKNYEQALRNYTVLIDSFNVDEEAIRLNLAHSYFHLKKLEEAKTNYSALVNTNNKNIRSIALQQLGVISKEERKLEESIQYLKSAIKSNPLNKDAQYNYEVVKKLLKNSENQSQDSKQENQQDKDQQSENQQNQEQQDQSGSEQQNEQQEQKEGQEQEEQKEGQEQQEQKEGQEQQEQKEGQEQEEEKSQNQMTKEKLQEMKISEEKARMILEAMRQNEIKYLQQQKRKATKKPDRGKPDW